MGETGYKVEIEGKSYTPQEISAMILQYLKGYAEEYLGEKVDKKQLLQYLHTSTTHNVKATKDAGRIAGLEVERIVNEPTAAALCIWFVDKVDHEEKS